MSEQIEKEQVLSTLVSAMGAWLGLGAGLCLLAFAFMAALASNYSADLGSDLQAQLRMTLGADLASADGSQVHVGEDGRTLRFTRTKDSSGALEPIVYSFSSESQELVRESGSEGTLVLGRCSSFTFARESDTIVTKFQTDSTTQRGSWALNRWALQ